jgi:hypothetical protein
VKNTELPTPGKQPPQKGRSPALVCGAPPGNREDRIFGQV